MRRTRLNSSAQTVTFSVPTTLNFTDMDSVDLISAFAGSIVFDRKIDVEGVKLAAKDGAVVVTIPDYVMDWHHNDANYVQQVEDAVKQWLATAGTVKDNTRFADRVLRDSINSSRLNSSSNLMFGGLGNGLTVYDKSRRTGNLRLAGNDYLEIAHITTSGLIKYYADVNDEERAAICKRALLMQDEWLNTYGQDYGSTADAQRRLKEAQENAYNSGYEYPENVAVNSSRLSTKTQRAIRHCINSARRRAALHANRRLNCSYEPKFTEEELKRWDNKDYWTRPDRYLSSDHPLKHPWFCEVTVRDYRFVDPNTHKGKPVAEITSTGMIKFLDESAKIPEARAIIDEIATNVHKRWLQVRARHSADENIENIINATVYGVYPWSRPEALAIEGAVQYAVDSGTDHQQIADDYQIVMYCTGFAERDGYEYPEGAGIDIAHVTKLAHEAINHTYRTANSSRRISSARSSAAAHRLNCGYYYDGEDYSEMGYDAEQDAYYDLPDEMWVHRLNLSQLDSLVRDGYTDDREVHEWIDRLSENWGGIPAWSPAKPISRYEIQDLTEDEYYTWKDNFSAELARFADAVTRR